jgi:hypothetical protein
MENYTSPEARTHTPDFSIRRLQIHAKPLVIVAAVLLLLSASSLMAERDDDANAFLPNPVRAASTVPPNGDVNPYGVAFVPPGFPAGGTVNPGDILVSNFNSSQNLQGTGTTIVRIPPNAAPSVFFQGQAPLGLSTALNILRKGFVLVGNFPSSDGTCGMAQPGSILIINSSGQQVGSIVNPSLINGPWDSALFDQGSEAKFFVANGLTGTIVRFDLDIGPGGVSVDSATQIASGYKHQCDPVTFVDAPTGLVYDHEKDVLYVASADDNAVFAIADAGDRKHDGGVGKVIYADPVHLHGPLGMVRAPNGHLVVANNDSTLINADPNQPSEIVEFTIGGKFVKEISVDPNLGGSFGLAVETSGDRAQFAAVDDNVNVLLIWPIKLP